MGYFFSLNCNLVCNNDIYSFCRTVFVINVFRQRFAPILFIIFSFYFGWFYEPQMDLLVHYEHFHRIADKSLVEQWMDSGTSKYGKEIYPVLFKYFIGLIADNRNFSLLVRVWYILLYLYLES